MTAQTPAGGPLVDGPHDPEHDPRASYALEPEYVAALTRRIVASSGRTAAVFSPLNGQPIAHVPQSTPADVAEAYARARRAQESWARTPLAERAAMLLRLHDLVLDRQDEILDLIVLGVGQGPQARVRRAGARRADRPLLRPHRPRSTSTPERRARRRAGPHQGRGQPHPQGRRRDHLALELPLHDGAVRRPPGPARRQRRGRQARRADDAVGAARCPAARGGRAARRPVAGRRRSRAGARPGDHRAAPTTSASPARRRPAGSSRSSAPSG